MSRGRFDGLSRQQLIRLIQEKERVIGRQMESISRLERQLRAENGDRAIGDRLSPKWRAQQASSSTG